MEKEKKNFYNNKVKVKDKYLNRKINTRVKDFNGEDKLIFDCNYLNGKRNGLCDEYKNEHLIFYGEYLNGKKSN